MIVQLSKGSANQILYVQLTSKLNSSSASKVYTLTGNDLPDFLRLNGGILSFIFIENHCRIKSEAPKIAPS